MVSPLYPPDIAWNTPIAPKPLFSLLDESARRYPNDPYLDFLGRKFTYREIFRQVENAAFYLQSIGVRKGTRVGLFMPNCPQFVIAYYAILKASGIVVNFSPLYAEEELRHQAIDSGTEILFTLGLRALYPKAATLLTDTPVRLLVVDHLDRMMPMAKHLLFPIIKHKEVVDWPEDDLHLDFATLTEEDAGPMPVDIRPEKDIAVLQYTGGTTGTPKGAMLTHANLYTNAVQAGLWLSGPEGGRERMMGVLPLFHVFAMTVVMNLATLKGMEIILHPRFELKKALEDIAQKKPTLMPGVPTMFAAICNSKGFEKYDLSSVKRCISGGAPLPLEVKQAFEQKTGASLVEGYGLTESSPIVACNPLYGENRAGAVGLPLPLTIIEAIHQEDQITPMPIGEIGEICIRGPQVMQGYWNKPEETQKVLKNGRLHTGDLGFVDSDGYVHIVDRLKEMIISGGFNIYPRHIEEALYQHPAVLEAAVIGLPHPMRGQKVVAHVVLRDGSLLKEAELKTFLRDRIASYSIPSDIVFRDSLPKTMIGKIAKKEIVKEAMASS